MNARRPLAPVHPAIAEALGRLADLGAAAGQALRPLPAVMVDAALFDRLLARPDLSDGERQLLALLAAIECDAAVARHVATLQAGVGGSRLLAGLAVALIADPALGVACLYSGAATRTGLIEWQAGDAPLPERALALPDWLAARIGGGDRLPPGVAPFAAAPVPLAPATDAALDELAAALAPTEVAAETRAPLLIVLRARSLAESRAMAARLSAAASRRPVLVDDPALPGLEPWLDLSDALMVVAREAGPGEAIDLSAYDALAAPLLLVAGPHGHVVSARRIARCDADLPDAATRAELWQHWGLDPATAALAAARYRHSAGRIADIGRTLPATVTPPDWTAVRAAIDRHGGRIDGLARRAQLRVARDDIVLPPPLADALDRLRDRILLRHRLADGLGPTIGARYLPGVRALLTGESGTGKTLAAHWLAEQAGLPLYRVDLAALTSKWIGETEKNLAQLLDAAEEGDVLLFFDEADALFGARTDVADAHDRHANAQTNFLLQGIEDYAGVALLATNSRDRFDPAFVRRLDMLLEFPLPDAAARRALWDRHLGSAHDVPAARLDDVATAIDLAGGHVRNVVLAAAARALAVGRRIEAADLDAAIAEEYAKLGRTAPPC